MKKLNPFYKIFFYFFLFIIFIFSKTILSKEQIEEKVKKLTLQLRCMTCQNQSIYDSDSDFSKDIIKIVESKFKEGHDEEKIKSFLVERYGEYILFKQEI